MYKDLSDIDAQEVFNYHDALYKKCLEDIVIGEQIESRFALGNEETVDSISLEERVSACIKEHEANNKPPQGIPIFNLEKYLMMEEIRNSPHIKECVDGKIIALFAGDKTDFLVSRLQEINLQIGEPIKNLKTGVWNYTIANSSSFVGLVYRDFLEYVNTMLDSLGRIPTCGWCKQPITPTGQQLRKIREGSHIYHKNTDCANRGRSFNQNLKRSKERAQGEPP